MLMGLTEVWIHQAAPGQEGESTGMGKNYPSIPKSCLLKVSWRNAHSLLVELTPAS